MLEQAVGYATLFLDSAGAAIVVYGSACALVGTVRIELGKKKFQAYENEKRKYVQKLILALDFFVAADLLKLVAQPTMDEIVLIAIVVAIRTLLNYFLSKEIHLHRE